MTAVIVLAISVVVLSFALAALALSWARERKDLLNRLMSKDVSEYIRVTSAGNGEKSETKRQKRAREWRGEKRE